MGPDLSKKMERLPAPLIVQDEVIHTNMYETFFSSPFIHFNLMQVMSPQDPFPFSFLLFLEELHPIYSSLLNYNMKIDIVGEGESHTHTQKSCPLFFLMKKFQSE